MVPLLTNLGGEAEFSKNATIHVCCFIYSKETVEEFQKLFVENEVLKDSVTGLQQQYRSTAESNEVSRILQYLVVEHKALT